MQMLLVRTFTCKKPDRPNKQLSYAAHCTIRAIDCTITVTTNLTAAIIKWQNPTFTTYLRNCLFWKTNRNLELWLIVSAKARQLYLYLRNTSTAWHP